MKITSLKLTHFGKFNQKEIELKSGLNVIYGDNEAGKSTIHAFIYGMFFGIERLRGRAGKEDKYTKYQPWDTPGAYQGSMDFEHDGKCYRLNRVFYQKEKSCILTELDTGRTISLPDGKITGLIPELTESIYRNTISIEQLHAKTDTELSDNVRNYIANMTLSKSEEVDVKGALAVLADKKKKLDRQYDEADTEALERLIEDCLEKEQEAEKLADTQKNLEIKLETAKKEYQEFTSSEEYANCAQAEKYPIYKEKYNMYKEADSKLAQFTQQIAELEKNAEEPDKLEQNIKECEQKLAKLEELHKKRVEAENSNSDSEAFDNAYYDEEQNENQAKPVLLNRSAIVLTAIGALACIISNNRFTPGIFIGIILIILGLVLQLRSYFKYKEQQKQLEAAQEEYRNMRRRAAEAEEEKRQRIKQAADEEAEYIRENGSYDELRRSITELSTKKASVQVALLRREQLAADKEEYERRAQELAQELAAYGAGFIPGSADIVPDDEYMDRLRTETTVKSGNIKKTADDMAVQINNMQHELERVSWELSRYAENESILFESIEKKKELVQTREIAQSEREAVELATDTIKELAADIHDSFGKELNKAISHSTEVITAGAHKELFIDEDLNTTIMTGAAATGLERFSTGTIDQVYLALRLAIADMFFEHNDIPLIFDDTFAFYDDKRLEATLEHLAEQKDSQIIIFSCHDREARSFAKKGIPYNEIRLES